MRIFLAALTLALPLASFADQAHVGRRAPGFALPDLNINYHDLADYRGKVVLLDFIKTACPVCQSSQKIYETIRLKYPDKVAVLAIVLPPDTQETVRAFVTANSMKTPTLFDCGQATASYLKLSPTRSTITFPNLFLIDGNGIIRGHHEYAPGQEKYFEQLDPLLNEVEALVKGGAAKPAGPAAPKPPAKK